MTDSPLFHHADVGETRVQIYHYSACCPTHIIYYQYSIPVVDLTNLRLFFPNVLNGWSLYKFQKS